MTLDYLTVEHLNSKIITRIFSKIKIHSDLSFNETPCWIWHGGRDRDGYGLWSETKASTTVRLHRYIFAWLVHPLPKGQQYGEIDHLCRRRPCCNPVHLEFVPTKINCLRGNSPSGINARKTHCKRGHPLSGENLFYDQGKRQCRACCRKRDRQRKQAGRDAAKLCLPTVSRRKSS